MKKYSFRENSHFNTTMQPGSFVKFARNNFFIQLYKFVMLNLKIIRLIIKGH
jgi:hypothetical protein